MLFFVIDQSAYKNVITQAARREIQTPDEEFFNRMRRWYKTNFGFTISGDLYDSEFDGDGTYKIDTRLIKPGLPPAEPPADTREYLRRYVWKMGSLFCAKCISNEISGNPDLEWPTSISSKSQWAINIADRAINQGWDIIEEGSDFGPHAPLCPDCQ